MNHDEHDDLWQLLGKAREPVISPFFSRRVVRIVQPGPAAHTPRGWLLAFLGRWQLPAAATCALAITALALRPHASKHSPSASAVTTARAPAPATLVAMAQNPQNGVDFGVIGNLDELLDSEQSSVWLGSDTY